VDDCPKILGHPALNRIQETCSIQRLLLNPLPELAEMGLGAPLAKPELGIRQTQLHTDLVRRLLPEIKADQNLAIPERNALSKL